MKAKAKGKASKIALREGKPSAAILDINDYRERLERLEDLKDLNMLKAMRKRPLRFRKLEDLLKEYQPSV